MFEKSLVSDRVSHDQVYCGFLLRAPPKLRADADVPPLHAPVHLMDWPGFRETKREPAAAGATVAGGASAGDSKRATTTAAFVETKAAGPAASAASGSKLGAALAEAKASSVASKTLGIRKSLKRKLGLEHEEKKGDPLPEVPAFSDRDYLAAYRFSSRADELLGRATLKPVPSEYSCQEAKGDEAATAAWVSPC